MSNFRPLYQVKLSPIRGDFIRCDREILFCRNRSILVVKKGPFGSKLSVWDTSVNQEIAELSFGKIKSLNDDAFTIGNEKEISIIQFENLETVGKIEVEITSKTICSQRIALLWPAVPLVERELLAIGGYWKLIPAN